MFRQDIEEIKDFKLNKKSDFTWGDKACALSCIYDLVEQIDGVYYSPKVAKLYAIKMNKHGFLEDDFMVHWIGCFKALGFDVDVTFEKPDYLCLPGEYEILELNKPGYTHFVRGNGKGQYSWDSLGIRDSQKYYHIAEKRIITFKGIV